MNHCLFFYFVFVSSFRPSIRLICDGTRSEKNINGGVFALCTMCCVHTLCAYVICFSRFCVLFISWFLCFQFHNSSCVFGKFNIL